MIKVYLSWHDIMKIAKESAENYKFLQNNFPNSLAKRPIEDVLANKGYDSCEFYINSLEDIPDWLVPHCNYTVAQTMKLHKNDGAINVHRLQDAIKMNQTQVNDIALMSIDECMVAEDCCTDSLNDFLSNGWRIIAVCIQVGQRRPDYILGKGKKLPKEDNSVPTITSIASEAKKMQPIAGIEFDEIPF